MRRISSRNYLAGLKMHLAPIIVWLGVVACVAAMFTHRSRRFQVLGIAQGQVHQISSTCTARLKSVTVGLFDDVKKGQVLAVLDTVLDNENIPEVIQAQLDTFSAEVAHLQAELAATRDRLGIQAANLQRDTILDQRRFDVNVEAAKLRVLQLEAAIEADRRGIESIELDGRIFVLQGRLDVNDAAPYELKKIKLEYNNLQKRIADNEGLLAETQRDLEQAQHRLDEFAQNQPQPPPVDSELQVIRSAIQVQQQRMNELQVRRPLLELKAPFDGVVSLIQRGPGETVRAGEPILTVAETKPREVVAYASEKLAGRVKERMVVELIRTAEPAGQDERLVASSQVVEVGPTVEQMPARLWRNPNVPQWGRPIMIKTPPNLNLVPGEVVGVRGL
jgi:multidrug resistance efflux pump